MRVTGGTLRSRRVREVGPKVRPTQDRVREALFSALGARVVGARVLDIFAGTGVQGIEAWSRGAESVCCVERDRAVYAGLKKNVADLCGEGDVRVVLEDAFRFLSRVPSEGVYDIILADPPYDPAASGATLRRTLRSVRQGSMLAASGVLVYEQSDAEPVPDEPGWVLLRSKPYGKTRLLFFQAEDGSGGREIS